MKHLIIVRLGKNSIHKAWLYRIRKLVDVAFIYYDESNFSEDSPNYEAFFEGTKLTGIKKFIDDNQYILEKYDYFWLFEDDLLVSYETVAGIVSFTNKYKPVLSAPSLTADSFYTHILMLQNTSLMLRGTDFVECMSPIMSRDFLRHTLQKFEEFPVWGIEFYWRHLLWEMRELAFIYDKYPITHTRPVGHGSLYKHSDGANINYSEDNFRASEAYGKPFKKYINILFGMEDKFDPEVLVGDSLRRHIDYGYSHLAPLHGEHVISQVKNDTYFANDLFTQFLSFPRIQKLYGLPEITPLESQLMVRKWKFGRVDPHTEWTQNLKFDISGKIIGYNNPNECYWEIKDGKLIILNENKVVSTIFDEYFHENNKIHLHGEHRISEKVRHYLIEN